jgi:hypothetical protein
VRHSHLDEIGASEYFRAGLAGLADVVDGEAVTGARQRLDALNQLRIVLHGIEDFDDEIVRRQQGEHFVHEPVASGIDIPGAFTQNVLYSQFAERFDDDIGGRPDAVVGVDLVRFGAIRMGWTEQQFVGD